MRHLLFIDFESYYSKKDFDLKKLSMIQYVRDPRYKTFGMGVAEGTGGLPHWVTAACVPNYIDTVAKTRGWENIAVVGHNIKFDALILSHIYGVTPGQYIDTKAMSKAVLGKLVKAHSLATLAEHFKLESKGKMETDGKRILSAPEEEALATYCLHDVELCREIYLYLAKEFPQGQYESMHRTIDMFVNPKFELDVPLLQQTSLMEAERRANIFKEIGIDKSEFASNAKFPALLISKGYEVPTKLSPKRKNEDGTPSKIPALALGDPQFLEMLESQNEELKLLCEARVAAKSTLLETRSAKLAAVGATGLWPFDVEYSGADQTQRWSGGPGAGGNPQNFQRCQDPKAHKQPGGHFCRGMLRYGVRAPEGHVLVVGDFSQVEFRIVAYLSKDPGLIALIEKGVDFYCDYASSYYGRKITKADDFERRFGKEALLGLGYQMGAKKFQTRIKIKTGQVITEDQSQAAVDLYRSRYAGVPRLWERLEGLIPVMLHKDSKMALPDIPVTFVHQGFILPSGLKVKFPNLRRESVKQKNGRMKTEWAYDIWDKKQFQRKTLYGGKLLENMSQAIAGEFTKLAVDEMGDLTAGQVHDEIIAVTKRGLELVTMQKMRRVMSVSPSWFPEILLECEVGVGQNWGSCK